MARPSKYNWDEIANLVKAGMSRNAIMERYGCSSGRLSEELSKRGIKEADPVLVKAKDAIVNAVRAVSEVSEHNGEKNSVIEVASYETGRKLRMLEIMEVANEGSFEVYREKLANGEATLIDGKCLIDQTKTRLEAEFGKSPDTAIQINNELPSLKVVYDRD